MDARWRTLYATEDATMSLRPDHAALIALCERLAEATLAGAVEWDDEHNDHYLWTSPRGRASVGSRDRNGEPPYELFILNSHGEKVEELHSGIDDEEPDARWNAPLAELYRVARRSALRADQIIEELMNAIPVAQAPSSAGSDFWDSIPVGEEHSSARADPG